MKNTIAIIALIFILAFSYFYQKREILTNPLEYPLQSINRTVTLKEFKDQKRPVLIYFGFLSCPEACPTTLAKLANSFKEFSEEDLNKFEVLFIDLDPEKDSLEDIHYYTKYFSEKIIPISIPLNDLDKFTKLFGVVFMKVKLDKSELDYTIDHSLDIIVIDENGKLAESIHFGSPKPVIVDRIKTLIKKDQK